MPRSPLKIPGPLGSSRPSRWRAGIRRRAYPVLALLGEFLPRAIDMAASAAALGLLAPLLLARALRSRRQAGCILARSPRIGRYQVPFRQVSFAGTGRFRHLAVWLNIWRGDMAIVGPRPLTAEEEAAVPVADLARFTVRPGLVSPFRIRRRIGIAHHSESTLDRELVYSQTVTGDLGLAAHSVVSGLLGGDSSPKEMPSVLNFFGVPVVNTTMTEAVDWILARAAGQERTLLAFVNPDCLNLAWEQEEYCTLLQQAERVLPDGIGIHLGCRMLGQALRANVNGTDQSCKGVPFLLRKKLCC